MCNILEPAANCQQCFKAVEFEPLPQPCNQIANTSHSEIGACGTLTSQKVSGPRDRLCENCRNPAQLEADRRNDSNGEINAFSLADYLESFLPPSEMTAHSTVAQQGSQATALSETEHRMRERRVKYMCPSETSSEDAEDVRVPADSPAALSTSKAQPPWLETVLDAANPRVHTPTPRSATSLRIETPWNTECNQARNDPWWYPEIWGPAKDLPRELADLLRRIPPADTFHNHRIYVFHNGGGGDDDAEQATVLLATPEGSRARVVSGALYDEGARLVTRRQLARTRYEELSREERDKMAKGEQCCIFYPCRVASCPLLHAEGQHQPIAPNGESLLAAMERGYAWRKSWGSTRIPRPTSPVSSRRRYGGSRSPPRQRGSPPARPQNSNSGGRRRRRSKR